jgi:uncharacterized protein DUF4177
VQRWEYKVVSFEDGRYTESLNAHAEDGWELQAVVPDVHEVAPAAPGKRRSIPMPGALGLAADAASTLSSVARESKPEPVSGTVTTFLWVLRRPVEGD